MELTKRAGLWGNSRDDKGNLVTHARNWVEGTPCFGFKEAKDYVEDLEAWTDPRIELKNIVETIKDLRSKLPNAIQAAFPGIEEEKLKRAMEDESYLEKIASTGFNTTKFSL